MLAAVLRQAAWILHAAVDGMVVGAIPSVVLLPPVGFAVAICALQDALALSVFLTRRAVPRRQAVVVLILFAIAFPSGVCPRNGPNAAVLSASAEGHRSECRGGR